MKTAMACAFMFGLWLTGLLLGFLAGERSGPPCPCTPQPFVRPCPCGPHMMPVPVMPPARPAKADCGCGPKPQPEALW